ncbi:MAG: 23S rRNA (adenine(2030)-N(6))-methyltransferase RlmJ, partial [Pseudomonadota bacterium]
MNYRHAYHAGNHADVLKHVALTLILNRLRAKAKPFVAVDAFAGPGLTDLMLDDRAARTGEWRGGVGRLWSELSGLVPHPASAAAGSDSASGAPARREGEDAASATEKTREALGPYLQAFRHRNEAGALRYAPGSPLLMLDALRPGDKLLAVEKHPEDAAALRRVLSADRRARVYEEDGWKALRSFLPPTPRRGAVLIDPPFEEPGDFERLAEALSDGVRRWATGVFALWHPVKDRRRVAAYERALARAAGAAPLLLCELCVRADEEGGLLGSGVAVANPPYGLEAQMAVAGPALAARLAAPTAAGWRLSWLTP